LRAGVAEELAVVVVGLVFGDDFFAGGAGEHGDVGGPFRAADFAEVRNPLLTWIGNPLLTIYWRLARLLLWW
jgi:hypothetical protein